MAPKPLVDEVPPFKRKKSDRYRTGLLSERPMLNWLQHQTFNLVPKGRVGSSPTGRTLKLFEN